MACVVIKLIPRSVCNCNQQAAANTPAAAVPAQAATHNPGTMAAMAAAPAATAPAEPEEEKANNWWKWALGGLAVVGLLAFSGKNDKGNNKKSNRR